MRSNDEFGYGLVCDSDEMRSFRLTEGTIYFLIWTLGPILLYAGLLRVVHEAVKKRRPTELSTATQFLHSEYDVTWAGSFVRCGVSIPRCNRSNVMLRNGSSPRAVRCGVSTPRPFAGVTPPPRRRSRYPTVTSAHSIQSHTHHPRRRCAS